MTFLIDVLLAPVTLPTKGLLFVFEKIKEEAEREFNDPVRIRTALRDLQQRADAGQIPLDRYEAAEAILLHRLDVIESHRAAAQRPEKADVLATPATRNRRAKRPRRSDSTGGSGPSAVV